VGNARWRGVPLSDLLRRAEPARSGPCVVRGRDEAPLPGVPRFVRSIPIEKALDDVLLADRMNGEAASRAPRRTGARDRAGWYGMASTKWVTRVRIEAEPSDNHFMVRGYRYVAPGGDPLASPPVEEMPREVGDHAPARGSKVSLPPAKPPKKLQVRGALGPAPAACAGRESRSTAGQTLAARRLHGRELARVVAAVGDRGRREAAGAGDDPGARHRSER
jgi:DMSO/TMAO reductase YedYZ molybdopterin-dependent catalytic subunit